MDIFVHISTATSTRNLKIYFIYLFPTVKTLRVSVEIISNPFHHFFLDPPSFPRCNVTQLSTPIFIFVLSLLLSKCRQSYYIFTQYSFNCHDSLSFSFSPTSCSNFAISFSYDKFLYFLDEIRFCLQANLLISVVQSFFLSFFFVSSFIRVYYNLNFCFHWLLSSHHLRVLNLFPSTFLLFKYL